MLALTSTTTLRQFFDQCCDPPVTCKLIHKAAEPEVALSPPAAMTPPVQPFPEWANSNSGDGPIIDIAGIEPKKARAGGSHG